MPHLFSTDLGYAARVASRPLRLLFPLLVALAIIVALWARANDPKRRVDEIWQRQREITTLPNPTERVSAMETLMRDVDANARHYLRIHLCRHLFEAEQLDESTACANLLLEEASAQADDWNHGNAVHDGHALLDEIALRRGDVDAAERHLSQAGETPGSPQLGSYGPKMTLARELLALGLKDAVRSYLEACRKFWRAGSDAIDPMIRFVETSTLAALELDEAEGLRRAEEARLSFNSHP